MSGVESTLSGRPMAELCVFGRQPRPKGAPNWRPRGANPARALHQA